MDFERVELKHDKKVTAIFCILYFIAVAGLGACIALIGVNFNAVIQSVNFGLTIAIIVLLSVCILILLFFLVNQAAKLRRDVIFIADENGIYDYSRHVVLKPIAYADVQSIEYKEVLSDDISDFRHLKINLKDKRAYMKKLNLLQKISFLLEFRHVELHLFSAKVKVKELTEKLNHNLEVYNQSLLPV